MIPLALLKHWKLILTGASIAVLGLMLVLAKADARHWHKRADQEAKAHAQTIANYKAAQSLAEAAQKANTARVLTQQATINERHSDALEIALDDARARYNRLRAESSHRSSADNRMSAPGQSAGQSGEACPNQGLSLEERLVATEQAVQLDALIGWVNEQAGVNTSEAPQ